MNPVPKGALLVVALALPIAAVVASYGLSDGPRSPQVPAEVRIGGSDTTEAPPSSPPTKEATPKPSVPRPLPTELPPPPPIPGDDDDGADDGHDD